MIGLRLLHVPPAPYQAVGTGNTVTVAALLTPRYTAEMVTVSGAATSPAGTLNVAVVEPAPTVTFGGTGAEGSELDKVTSAPPAGAGPFRDTVPLAITP